MARVTVEDCLEHLDNRFELILVAAKRAHQLNSGSYKTTLNRNGDKAAVIALREIAEGIIDASILKESYEISPGVKGIDMSEIEQELSQTVMKESEGEQSGFSIEDPDLTLKN